jgi:hypothetical protein
MDRQPLILAIAMGLAGCDNTFVRTPSFDGPSASTVLDSREMGPFEEPVGFVANSRNGRIVPIDLKHATLLSDQVAAPFLRPRWTATGTGRLLGQLAVWAPTDEQVTLFVADNANNVLVEAPYITGMDPNPLVADPSVSASTFDDKDDSGDDSTLENIVLANGWTTTETWTLEYDGSEWTVIGSASGLQTKRAQFNDRFKSDNHEVAFKITGKATRGDTLTFDTDTGIIEHDLGGNILALKRVPEQPLLVASVFDPLTETNDIVVWDLDLRIERGRFTLPEGSQGWRFSFGESEAELYIADARNPRVFEVLFDIEDPAVSVWQEIPTAAPVSDVAWISDSLTDGELALDALDTGGVFDDPSIDRDYEHLFVALAGASRVDVYDLRTGSWINVNPLDGVVGGLDLTSPVVGIAPSRERVYLPERNDLERRIESKVVAVTTYNGSLLLLEGATGCVATSYEGPHVPITQGYETVQFNDTGRPSNPSLLVDDATARRVQTSHCGGVLRTERWSLTFDEIQGNWEVDGSLSGVQNGRAEEDVRYVSDNGSISFTVVAGSEASSDGDNFDFYTDEGILRIDRMLRQGASQADALELPAAPTLFEYRMGNSDGGWDSKRERTMVLLPVVNSDVVLRVRVKQWDVEVVWD